MKQQGITLFSLLLTFIAPQAFADAAVGAAAANMGSGGAMTQGIMLAAFAVIFYFLFIRPQSKRAKEHQRLVTDLQKGDEVVTTGGLLGKITRLSDNFFVMTIAEGVEVPVQRNAIAMSVPKGTIKSLV
jgi:preprotein translocase subunit YajC